MAIKEQAHTGVLNDWLAYIKPVTSFFGDYPLATSLVVLVLSVLIAGISVVIVTRVAGRFARKTRFHWDDQIIAALRRPVFWSLLFTGLMMALLPLKLPVTFINMTESVVATVLVIMWSGFVMRMIRIVLRAMSSSSGKSIVPIQALPLFENLGIIVVLVVSIYFIFRSWNIDMTAWLASAGIAGIAIGFAAKDTLANLFSGVFILADTPYKIGDYVVLDSGERGKVTHIGIRSTRLLTRDDVEITIPNAIMGNTRIINESGGPHEKYRIRVSVGVAYGSDIDQVKAILQEIAVDEAEVCNDPEPRVRFRKFGASSLDVDLMCWIENPEFRGRVLDVLNTTIYKRLNAEGIEIPYSKQDVYIKEMPGNN